MMYGCHNKPRPTEYSYYVAQVGWINKSTGVIGIAHREPVYKPIKSAFGTTSCQYDKSATDTSCKGCQWAKTE